jgi:hypothetical protein
VLEVLAREIRQEKEMKSIKIEELEEVKLSLLADDMTLYIDNHKDSIPKLSEIINKSNKISLHKINLEKSVALLYTFIYRLNVIFLKIPTVFIEFDRPFLKFM